jgi:hypothetical protein
MVNISFKVKGIQIGKLFICNKHNLENHSTNLKMSFTQKEAEKIVKDYRKMKDLHRKQEKFKEKIANEYNAAEEWLITNKKAKVERCDAKPVRRN